MANRIMWTSENLELLSHYPNISIKSISRLTGYSENGIRNQLLRMGKIDIYEAYDKGLIDFIAREYATHTNPELASACGVSRSTIERISSALGLSKIIDIVKDGKKLCIHCNEWKPEEEFITKNNTKTTVCLQCTKIRKQQFYFEYKEKKRINKEAKTKNRSPRNIYKFIDGVEHKQCKQCGEMVPLDKYYCSSISLDGKVNKCKKCIKNNKIQKQGR